MSARDTLPTTPDLVFGFLLSYMRQHGRPPSINDIAGAVYLSRHAVRYNLIKLESQGRIARTPGEARSIRVLR